MPRGHLPTASSPGESRPGRTLKSRPPIRPGTRGGTKVAENVVKGSGWVTFAGVMAVIAGGYNALSGIAALNDDSALASKAKEVLYGIDLTTWGWFWLI